MRAALTALPGAALLAAALCAPCAPSGAAQQQQQQRLRDPFERPAAPVQATRVAAAVAADVATAADAAPPWKPELRAILYDQARSLVNISGIVLAIGESVHGYRLARVDERGATLVKGGTSIRLTLDKKEPSP
jgi:hypothetical protein